VTLAPPRALLLGLLTALAQQACATATEPEAPGDDTSAGATSGGAAAGRAGNTTNAGTSAAGSAAHGGTGGAAGNNTGNGGAGRGNTGGSNAAGQSNGGKAGTSNGGGNGGNGGAAGGNGGASGGSVNQGGGTACDQAAATPLAAMSSNIAVKSDACLSIQIPADQTWIKKVTLQPEGANYPLSFTWSNCGTNSNAAFTANYGNVVLDSVTSQCPILIKLGGSGTSFNVQWWGG
jgi:hypothetical protein